MSFIKHARHDEICGLAPPIAPAVNISFNLADLRQALGPFDPEETVEIIVKKYLMGWRDHHSATRAMMKLGVAYQVADKTLDNALAAYEAARRRMGDAAMAAYGEREQ